MWTHAYWTASYWAPTYWAPLVEDVTVVVTPRATSPTYRVIGFHRRHRRRR